ncbi:unnamed protein product [Arctogadus glacialis]
MAAIRCSFKPGTDLQIIIGDVLLSRGSGNTWSPVYVDHGRTSASLKVPGKEKRPPTAIEGPGWTILPVAVVRPIAARSSVALEPRGDWSIDGDGGDYGV